MSANGETMLRVISIMEKITDELAKLAVAMELLNERMKKIERTLTEESE